MFTLLYHWFIITMYYSITLLFAGVIIVWYFVGWFANLIGFTLTLMTPRFTPLDRMRLRLALLALSWLCWAGVIWSHGLTAFYVLETLSMLFFASAVLLWRKIAADYKRFRQESIAPSIVNRVKPVPDKATIVTDTATHHVRLSRKEDPS